jgi:hypothetical protein
MERRDRVVLGAKQGVFSPMIDIQIHYVPPAADRLLADPRALP